MIKFTKKERNIIYKQVYENSLKEDWFDNAFICNHLSNLAGVGSYSILNFFPEFKLFRPKGYHICDPFICKEYNEGVQPSDKEFLGVQQLILLFCIEMTENKII